MGVKESWLNSEREDILVDGVLLEVVDRVTRVSLGIEVCRVLLEGYLPSIFTDYLQMEVTKISRL